MSHPWPSDSIVEEIFEAGLAIAFAVRHNLQDCLWVAAGRSRNARRITADKLLLQRCRGAFKKIELLPSLVEH